MSGPNSTPLPVPPSVGSATDSDVERRLDQLGHLMHRLVRSFRVPADKVELTPTQLVVLSFVAERPRRVGELATLVGAAQNTVSEVVARLTRAGLVSKKRDPEDNRAVVVGVTDAGLSALQARREAMIQAQRVMLSALSTDDQQRFVSAFEVITNMAERARSLATDTKRDLRRKK